MTYASHLLCKPFCVLAIVLQSIGTSFGVAIFRATTLCMIISGVTIFGVAIVRVATFGVTVFGATTFGVIFFGLAILGIIICVATIYLVRLLHTVTLVRVSSL